MTSAFILAKSSRSPLKILRDRLIPAAAIGNGDRPPSLQGVGGNIGQGMMPLSPQAGIGGSLGREELERMEQEACDAAGDESKDDERPAGDQDLPTVSNPGARGGVNYGGGSQEAKDAREKQRPRAGGESSSGQGRQRGRTNGPRRNRQAGSTRPSSPL
jgi:hypothetical protein